MALCFSANFSFYLTFLHIFCKVKGTLIQKGVILTVNYLKRTLVALFVTVILVLAISGIAYGSVAINPSSQMHNQGALQTYIEGRVMLDLGQRFKGALERRGVQSEVFWSGQGDRVSPGLVNEVNAANAYGASDFISLHTDAANVNKSNTMLLIFTSPAGERLAHRIGDYTTRKLGMNVEYRNMRFYVLGASRMPAVLIEVLNHVNMADTMRLLDNNYRQLLADTMAEAYTGNTNTLPAVAPMQSNVRIPKSSGVTVTPPVGLGVLSVGSRGANVVAAQQLLAARAYDITVDGVFGNQTKMVVKEFQSDFNLDRDGVVGSQTWNTLKTVKTYRVVGYGARGHAVTLLQQKLNVYFGNIQQDGVFGSQTNSAVRIFQRNNHLVEDGVVGAATWKVLG